MSKKISGVDLGESTKLPSALIMQSYYAFYDDDGAFLQWHHGQRVTEPDHIAMLVKRSAPYILEQ